MASGVALLVSLAAIAAACGSSDDDEHASPDAGAGTDSGTRGGGGGAPDATLLDGASGPDAQASTDGAADAHADADADAGPLVPQDAGAACTTGEQCVSGGCDDTGHCALARSCTQELGGRTCGADGGDSCCRSLPIDGPDGGYLLDKYSVTAGRFRVFITATGGNVRSYVQANRPAWFDPGWDSFLPIEMDDGTKVLQPPHQFPPGTGQDGVYQQLGPIHYGTEMAGNEDCLTNATGARTYRLPDEINSSEFNDVQQYAQSDLDPKPMQCATFYMFAAFCIWDGGRIPTLDELNYAWDGGDAGTHTYPWGNAPVPGGWDFGFDTEADAVKFGKVSPAGSDQTYANHMYNWWSPATESCIDSDAAGCDYSIYLAPPGRFPKGDGPFGHSDLAGDVYNVAMPPTTGSDPTTLLAGLARTGAFDTHAIPTKHPSPDFTYQATNKYIAVGARCAR